MVTLWQTHIAMEQVFFLLGKLTIWLVVWTPLKNISQMGWWLQIYGKIKHVPNHQPAISIWSFSIAMLVITRGYRKARFSMTIWRVTSHGHTSRPLWTNSIRVLEEVQCRIARMAPMVCSDGFKLITYHPPNTSHPLNTMIGYDWYVLQMGSNRYMLIATLISILKRNIPSYQY